MESSKDKPQNKNSAGHDAPAYIAWGTLAGSGLGLATGLLFTTHWLAMTILVGTLGMTIGGLVDRSRR